MDFDDSSEVQKPSKLEQEEKSKYYGIASTSDTSIGPGACTIMTKMSQNCPPQTCTIKPIISETKTEINPTKIVREILERIVAKSTKPKFIRRMKKPKMKSGCMDWHGILPKFDINDEMFSKITFTENLMISTIEGNGLRPIPVGGLCLSIQQGRGGPLRRENQKKGDFLLPKFLVHLSSQLDFMGCNGGSRITAWVDRELQTLEEKRREYLQLDDVFDEQALYVCSQENFYYLRHDRKTDIFYSHDRAKNLICEGSNFVLMRYLAITRYVGTFEVSTLYINGSLCRNIYECKGPSSGIVNNQKIDVCKIYRTVLEKSGIQHTSITLMTLHGQILKQEWRKCNYILHINPLAEIPNSKPCGIERIPTMERKDDLQMLSILLETKEQSKRVTQNYLDDHPEIRHMLSDYLQTILQLKPDDIFEFTAKHFLAFTPTLLPLSEYYEPTYIDDDEEDYEFWKYI